MAFSSERVSDQDIKNYGLEDINNKFLIGTVTYYWTIDRVRDIYLRWMKADRDEPSENYFSFFWKGNLLRVTLKSSGEGARGGKGSTTWTLLDPSLGLPSALESYRPEIIADLKEALKAFKDFGVFSTIADHTAYFNF